MMTKTIRLPQCAIGPEEPLTIIAGPCVMESEELCLRVAERLAEIAATRPISLVFKSSFDKANRSAIDSFRGPGIEEGMRILEKVRQESGLPLLTDVHTPAEARIAGEVCEIIQIPAFLCRQTDLLVAAAQTSAVVNIKKGQFLAPWDMKNAVEKVRSQGKEDILLTERGTSFGYNNLVVDYRSLPIMRETGCPVCFDVTHSLQLPGGEGKSTGGTRDYAPHLARAAVAVGVEALYLEVHPDPAAAKSDATTMWPLEAFADLLDDVIRIHSTLSSALSG